MADQTLSSWRRTVRSRVVVAAAILAAWVAVIEARLVQLQVVQHARWQAAGDGQRLHTVDLPARRGAITDRNGRVLAYSVDGEAVCAVPTSVKDVAGTVRALCEALGDCTAADRADFAERLSRAKPFVFVRHASRVSAEAARRIKELKLPGIWFLKEPLRFYPNDELAAHVIGYVGGENKGLSGVEGTYDTTLGGRNGKVLIEVDGNRQTFASIGEQPTPGPTLQLTIDYRLQFIAEQELKAAIEYNNARSGSVVILDPFTGDILAMANAPSFNPNTYQRFAPDDQRNRAIQDMYEPGSTFKIVTASAAIEEG
ncbi:MAG: peptidoglycan D,D-transpeptidase FtsI family protein, partial [Bacteroidales bacterium]